MRIEILSDATEDLLDGYHFYERQAPGLGDYFGDNRTVFIPLAACRSRAASTPISQG